MFKKGMLFIVFLTVMSVMIISCGPSTKYGKVVSDGSANQVLIGAGGMEMMSDKEEFGSYYIVDKSIHKCFFVIARSGVTEINCEDLRDNMDESRRYITWD